MRIAFIGDIVGRAGRTIINNNLKKIKDEYKLDIVVANCENASGGFGITPKNANELLESGIDIFTGGNHSFDKKETFSFMNELNILRPYNYPDELAGEGYKIIEYKNRKIAIISLMGIYGMPSVDNPFRKIVKLIDNLYSDNLVDSIFIDFHAEATAEKETLLHILKGKVTAIVGTHTHIGTDDLKIIENTAYVTDIGLTGCRDMILGMDIDIPIKKALTSLGGHFAVPKQCKKILQIIIIDFDNMKSDKIFKVKILE